MTTNTEYTSSSEFDLVKRVQITNEVPNIDLSKYLPSGMQKEIWNYLVGDSSVERDLDLRFNKPIKTVNGVEAQSYGPDDTEGTFHSMNVSGIVMPEYDLFLHELYRYLDLHYPDHPDYAILLTQLELNEAFNSTAAFLGYTPDYTFLDTWSESIAGTQIPREQLKWKIRDLRSIAFRRKLFGSLSGYKTMFTSMHRHGSVYLTGEYSPSSQEDPRAGRRFRLVDQQAKETAVDEYSAGIPFEGVVIPGQANIVYEKSLLADSQMDRINTGVYLCRNGVCTNAAILEVVSTPSLTFSDLVEHKLELACSIDATTRTYLLDGIDVELCTDPEEPGVFHLDKSGFFTKPEIDQQILDEIKGSVSTYNKAKITEVLPGTISINFNKVKSPIATKNSASGDEISLGIEVSYFNLDLLGNTTKVDAEIIIEGSLEIETDLFGYPETGLFTISNLVEVADEFKYFEKNELRINQLVNVYVHEDEKEHYLSGRLSAMSYGKVKTVEVMRDSQPQPNLEFTSETFEEYRRACSEDFYAEFNKEVSLDLYGTVTEEFPKRISLSGVDVDTLQLVSIGDVIRGAGIPTGTMISNIYSSYIELTDASLQYGSLQYTVLTQNKKPVTPSLFDFRNEAENPNNVFNTLWPSQKFNRMSEAYLEGHKDSSEFTIPDSTTLCNVSFDKEIFCEVSLDRVLRHANSLNYSMNDKRACLIDLPWLDYYDRYNSSSKRASGLVSIGSQLTMATDDSGFYSIIPGENFSDENIQSKFSVLPEAYNEDPHAAYIQFGTGGHDKYHEDLFTSVSDIVKPPIYGGAYYDENREFTDEEIRPMTRSVYTSSEAQMGDGTASLEGLKASSQLGESLFEIPIGEVEYNKALGPAYNSYQAINATCYMEQFKEVEFPAELVVNSPYIMMGEQLPRENWHYKGQYNAVAKDVEAAEPEVQYPTTENRIPGDYYVVAADTYVGVHKFTEGDWLVYDGIKWQRRQWLVLGTWPALGEESQEVYATPSRDYVLDQLTDLVDNDGVQLPLEDVLEDYFLYFIVNEDMKLVTKIEQGDAGASDTVITDVEKYDLVILTKENYNNAQVNTFTLEDNETPGNEEKSWYLAGTHKDEGTTFHLSYTQYQEWLIAGGRTYNIVKNGINQHVLSDEVFAGLAVQRQQLIEDTLQSFNLPRNHLALGSAHAKLRVDPQFKAKDIDGEDFSLTESAIFKDASLNLFYVNNDHGDGNVHKHYVAFNDPKFFKNLYELTGIVYKDTPNILRKQSDVSFAIDDLRLTDEVSQAYLMKVRNEYEAAQETQFYSHYVDILGKLSEDRTKITVVSDSPTSAVRTEDFRISASSLAVNDVVQRINPATIREYNEDLEFKYFKNLLQIAGRVYKSNTKEVVAYSEETADVFSNALVKLNVQDAVLQVWTSAGVTHTLEESAFVTDSDSIDSLNHENGIYMLSSGNKLFQKTVSTDFTAVPLTVFEEDEIITDTAYSHRTNQNYVVGSNGKLAVSFNLGTDWIEELVSENMTGIRFNKVFASADYDHAEDAESYIVVVGDGGNIAYKNEDDYEVDEDNPDAEPVGWITIDLPEESSVTLAEVDPTGSLSNNPGSSVGTIPGWDGANITALMKTERHWIIGGTSGKLAYTADLSEGFTMLSLPEGYEKLDITGIEFENDITVIIGNLNGKGFILRGDENYTFSITETSHELYDICYDLGTTYIVGEQGGMYSSTDSMLTFNALTAQTTDDIFHIAAGGNIAYGGDSSTVYYVESSLIALNDTRILGIGEEAFTLDNNIFEEDEFMGKDYLSVLFSIDTIVDVDDTYEGIPIEHITKFVKSSTGQLVTNQVRECEIEEANRVYLSRTNDYLTLPYVIDTNGDTVENLEYLGDVGYPLDSEDEELYYDADFTNSSSANIVLCNTDGNIIDADFEEILAYQISEEEGYDDLVTTTLTPKYLTYEDYLASGFDVTLSEDDDEEVSDITITEISNVDGSEPYIVFSAPLPELSDPFNGLSVNILPENPVSIPVGDTPHYQLSSPDRNKVFIATDEDGTRNYYDAENQDDDNILIKNIGKTEDGISTYGGDFTLEATSPSNYAIEDSEIISLESDGKTYFYLDSDITGLHFPNRGYGSFQGRATDDVLHAWDIDPDSFYQVDGDFVYLINGYGDFVYLTDALGEKVDGNIKIPAPKYLTYQDLLRYTTNTIEKYELNPDSTYVTNVVSAENYVELNKAIEFSDDSDSMVVKLHLKTLSSVDTTIDTKTDSRLVIPLTPKDLLKYEPDRVCYDGSSYPDISTHPDLFLSGNFTNNNNQPVYTCDADGNYVMPDSVTDTILAYRSQPTKPKYYLCQGWFEEEYYVEGEEDNPYWQYLSIEDKLDDTTKEWKIAKNTIRKVKGEFGKVMKNEYISDDDVYITIDRGLEFAYAPGALIVKQNNYINHLNGSIRMVAVSNDKYSKLINPNIDSDNSQFGLEYTSDFENAVDLSGDAINMFSRDDVVQTKIKATWIMDYSVNTTKNFADPLDRTSSVVAITELGIFNESGAMIAYSNFPPIIYDSARHHLSVNLFIKNGSYYRIRE